MYRIIEIDLDYKYSSYEFPIKFEDYKQCFEKYYKGLKYRIVDITDTEKLAVIEGNFRLYIYKEY